MANTATVFILKGLPGSGKTTAAEAWRAADPEHRVVVNRDQIRFHLYRKYRELTQLQEDIVTGVELRLADLALRQGKSVAADATNLLREHADKWVLLAKRHGVAYEVIRIDTPVAECLRRNRNRAAAGGRFVPESVILDMSEQTDWAERPSRTA